MKEWAEWFYKSNEWKECRFAFLESKGWKCERCEEPATIAHHKIYLTPSNVYDALISLNWDNLEALYWDCHNKEHHKRARPQRYVFDSSGDVIGVDVAQQPDG